MLETALGEAGVPFDRVSFLELNRSSSLELSVALLVFIDDEPAPFAFVKATPNVARARQLESEFRNLSDLDRWSNETFGRTVPKPIHLGHFDSLTVLVESALPGARMKDFPQDRYASSREFRRHLEAGFDWLDAFQTTVDAAGDDAPPLRLGATATVERFRECYRCSPEAESLLAETADVLWDYYGPVAPLHGDFCTANVIVSDDDSVSVIDWEYPLERSWPLADLLYFVASTWCTPYAKGREALASNFRELFFGTHAYTELLQSLTRAYMERLGVARELLVPLTAVSWASYANRKHDELEELARAGGIEDAASHMPLIMVEDERCLNLEILATLRDRFTLGAG
jgi:hypothetical protein